MMGIIDDERRKSEIMADELYGKYDEPVDNESAYEILTEQSRKAAEEKAEAAAKEAEAKEQEKAAKEKEKADKEAAKAKEKAEKEKAQKRKKTATAIGKVASSAANTIGREAGRSLYRGVLGILKKLF